MIATAKNPLFQIEQNYSQSIWVDNLSLTIIESGKLNQWLSEQGIAGITSNPSIFEKAIADNKMYDTDLDFGICDNKLVLDIYKYLVFQDIGNNSDIFKPVYEVANGLNGYVIIEVPPTIANDTESTIKEAIRYYQAIDWEKVMMKSPGTTERLPTVEQVISEGIKVNVTFKAYIDHFFPDNRIKKDVEPGDNQPASFSQNSININLDNVTDELLKEVIDKFVQFLKSLMSSLETKAKPLAAV
ncbi:transaldolase family protein [Lyngbya aestuarii]|uniref:transaldolase family protein n=1 Tax=Lyngbya aestuarii TaxID=118322 RepID=UPI00403DC1F0